MVENLSFGINRISINHRSDYDHHHHHHKSVNDNITNSTPKQEDENDKLQSVKLSDAKKNRLLASYWRMRKIGCSMEAITEKLEREMGDQLDYEAASLTKPSMMDTGFCLF